VVGPAAPDVVAAGVLEPPHAARTAIGTTSAMLARRERETVRPMRDPQSPRTESVGAIVDFRR
jgi:hypothetical protein